jgi:hypothetical protein
MIDESFIVRMKYKKRLKTHDVFGNKRESKVSEKGELVKSCEILHTFVIFRLRM